MIRGGRIAATSIAVSIAVLALKFGAWRITGSAALLSDALESIVNVATAGMALWALSVSARPPDANHPYGHAKVELFAAMTEGALIAATAVLILQQAALAALHPRLPAHAFVGIGVNAAGSVLNGVWAATLLSAGRRHNSPALSADGRHLAADVGLSAGVAVGVGLVALTGVARLDPAIAAVVAVAVLLSGYRLARESAGGLMDEAPSAALCARIESLLALHGAGALQAHDIRLRRAGRQIFLQFHLVVPAGMTVLQAHDICDRIEEGIEADLPAVVTTIHVEPEGKAHADGALVL